MNWLVTKLKEAWAENDKLIAAFQTIHDEGLCGKCDAWEILHPLLGSLKESNEKA